MSCNNKAFINFSRIRTAIIIALFISAVSMVFLTPIEDNDFFWHLATGRWIAEHKELPDTDQFSYTTSQMLEKESYRAKILLRMYWLANLLQFGIFSLAGFKGIVGLRVVIILLTLLIIGTRLRKKGLHIILILLLLIPLTDLLSSFVGDRPNQMSFLFCALFIYLADAVKKEEKKGYLLPLVMLIWANMHGGFILGAVMAVIMIISELLRKSILTGYKLNKKYIAVALAALCAGSLNPNGYIPLYSSLFERSGNYLATIAETRTPWSLMLSGQSDYVWMLGICLILAAWYFLSQIFSKTSRPILSLLYICDELLIVLFLAWLSYTGARYIPFLSLVVLWVIPSLFLGKIQDNMQKLSKYYIPELMVIAVSCWWLYTTNSYTVMHMPPVSEYYPDDAVQFIKQKEIKGRFYNFYDWGGYLIWQFYPEKSVFIDGRALVIRTYNESAMVLYGRQDMFVGIPIHKAILDSYSVRHIIIPAVDIEGTIVGMMKTLEYDPEWHLIFAGRNSLVYTRDQMEQNYPKSLGYTVAAAGAIGAISRFPDSVGPYLTLAKAYNYLGRQTLAIKALEDALKLRPSFKGSAIENALQLLKDGKEIPIHMR